MMDEIKDPKLAALIRRGLDDEQMRAKLMCDLFSADGQVQLRALESLRDYFGEQTDDIGCAPSRALTVSGRRGRKRNPRPADRKR